MIPELSLREAEAMDPRVYASIVTDEDYGEYAERTETDYVSYIQRLEDPLAAWLILEHLHASMSLGMNADALKKYLFYGKPLPEGMDSFWKNEGSPCMEVVQRLKDPSIRRLLHAGFGLITEAAEFNDALAQHIAEGEPLDKVNLAEELGDVCWYVGIGCRILGITLTALLRQNIAKLFQRFRGKFCYERVGKRDLDGERAVLEGGQ